MNWREELTLICVTILATRGLLKWFGDDFLMVLVGIGLAVVIGSRIRDFIKSKNTQERRASP